MDQSKAYIAIAIFFLLPASVIILSFTGVILVGTGAICLVIFVTVFLVIPVVYKNSYTLQRSLLFLNFVSIPVNFKNPKSVGLSGARNFYIATDDNATLGVWQILPASLVLSFAFGATDNQYEKALGDGKPVILYMHGNSGNRGSGHRVELYKILSLNNYHVIAFDYRSYGDSSPIEPSEPGVVADSKAVYRWLKPRARNSKIFFWGHSLGTGIASHLLKILESEGESITGLILEAPFNNMADEVRSYPLAKIFRYLPWFDYFFTQPMYKNGLRFETDKHLLNVKAPILILHAEDDIVIPISLANKLYYNVKNARNDQGLIEFKKYDRSLHFGHKFIYKDPKLAERGVCGEKLSVQGTLKREEQAFARYTKSQVVFPQYYVLLTNKRIHNLVTGALGVLLNKNEISSSILRTPNTMYFILIVLYVLYL